MKLSGKVALVTGGSGGIGEALSLRMAAEGAAVAIVARRVEKPRALAERIVAAGGTAQAFPADCSKIEEIDRLVETVSRHFGGIDILIHCAGAFISGSLESTTEEDLDKMLGLNIKGSFFLIQKVAPKMRERGGGRIVTISSIAGLRGFPNALGYCASKAGLIHLTRALATELARDGININTVAPGNVETDLNAHLRGKGNEDYRDMLNQRSLTGRDAIVPDDLVGIVAFLASDEARAMHGTVNVVDDGWCAT